MAGLYKNSLCSHVCCGPVANILPDYLKDCNRCPITISHWVYILMRKVKTDDDSLTVFQLSDLTLNVVSEMRKCFELEACAGGFRQTSRWVLDFQIQINTSGYYIIRRAVKTTEYQYVALHMHK